MRIQFLGAAEHVTGSMYHVESNSKSFLVDCGQFQGNIEETALNAFYKELDPSAIDFVILTHAHIDHSGRLPLLVKQGFKGKIYCTYPTMQLAEILLRDSGKIHEVENEWENKKRKRAGLEAIDPLYTEEDAIETIQYLYPLEYGKQMDLGKDLNFEYKNAGHLLGSSIAVINFTEKEQDKTIVFSGDLGNGTSFLEEQPEFIEKSNYLVVESTYGNRSHVGISERGENLVAIILKAYEENGTVLIPSFAVGRTQEILFEINHYIRTHDNEQSKLLSQVPIYLDSPLALDATDIYSKHSAYMSELIQTYGESPFKLKNLHIINHVEDSIALNFNTSSKVIISASGMCEAGRIKHHLKHNLWKPNTHVVFVGYQGEETLGRAILTGVKTVRILDEEIAVKAKIHEVTGFSGHADETQLTNWVTGIKGLEKVFVTHGEVESSHYFAEKLKTEYGLDTYVPELYEWVEI